MYEKRKDYLIDEALSTNLFNGSPKVTQTTKLRAYLCVPGNVNATVSDYAKHLKDRTVVQGTFDA